MQKSTTYRLLPLLMVLFVVVFASAVPVAQALPVRATFEDNYGFRWHVTVSVGRRLYGSIWGTVTTLDCGTWTVKGSYNGRSFTLTATNPGYNEDCADWFVYEGTWQGGLRTGSGSGSWYNSAGLSGTFTATFVGFGFH